MAENNAKISSPVCPNSERRLSPYRFPDNASKRVLGFTCINCNVEWFIKNYVLQTHDGHTIDHNGMVYYETLPSLVQKPTLRNVREIADLKRGDHIVWQNEWEHHAIVSHVYDSSFDVINFAWNNYYDMIVIRNATYKNIANKEMVDFRPCDKYDPLVILARALYMYEREVKLRETSDRFGDCESMANFCCTGVSISFHVGKVGMPVLRMEVLERAHSLENSNCVVL